MTQGGERICSLLLPLTCVAKAWTTSLPVVFREKDLVSRSAMFIGKVFISTLGVDSNVRAFLK